MVVGKSSYKNLVKRTQDGYRISFISSHIYLMENKAYFESLSANWELKQFLVSKNDPAQAPITWDRAGIDIEKFIRGSKEADIPKSVAEIDEKLQAVAEHLSGLGSEFHMKFPFGEVSFIFTTKASEV